MDFSTITSDLLSGFFENLKLFGLTLAFSLPLGLLVSFCSMSKIPPIRWLAKTVVWIIRGTPLMLQLFLVFFVPGIVFDAPLKTRFTAALIAFVINYSAYFSEIYRGGIESIPVGQHEAGMVLGMTRKQIFFKVVLMQVVKKIIPPMSNEIITLVKDTSLAFSLAVLEMFTIAKQISSSMTSMMPFVVAGLFYYIFNFVVAGGMAFIEKKLNYYRG